MKHRLTSFLFLILICDCISCFSQTNLVPNPSFEDTVACPNFPGQINYARYWQNPTKSSPDYFNECSNAQYGIPTNYIGNEFARTGKAYSHIAFFGIAPGLSNNFREYVQTRLDNVLIQSETYCIEFYVSLTDGIYTDYATSAMGAYFSATAVFANNYDPLPFNPQFSNPSSNFLTNYQGWTKVSGSFVAIGGEQFITIGNFKDNLNSDTLKVFNNNDIQKNSSYYIDDVSVVHLDADAGANKTICTGDSVRLGRSTQSYINYKWRANATLSDSTAAQPYAKPGTTTTYYLTATLTGSGCEKIDSVTVYVSNVSASITADTLLCPGQRGAATVTISTGSAPYTYSWSTGTTAISTNPQMAISNLTVGNYSVNIIDAFGCSTTTSVTFTNLPAPTASITTSKTTLTEGDSTVLTASPAANYLWQPPATLSCNTCSSPSAKPVSTTTYTLVVSNTNNCTDTASITIYVSPLCADEKTIFIPNIFSPNGDGKNDVLKLEGTGISNIYFAIYNRWGNLIFETHNQSRGWDGTQRGNPCEAGTYVYYLRATCSKTNSEVSLKGNVSLIR